MMREYDWPRLVERRRALGSWQKVAKEAQVSWPTFYRHLQQARAAVPSPVPPEDQLTPNPHTPKRPPAPPAPLREDWWEPLPEGWAPTIQPFQDLPPAIEAAFRASIQRFGVLLPVVKDQYNRVLDGHQRVRVAEALGVPYETTIRRVASDDEALALAKTLNAERRQLSEEQRRAVAFVLRQEGHSLRAIGAALGVSHVQARTDVQKAEAERGVNHLTPEAEGEEPASGVKDLPPAPVPRIRGRDQKSYPATRRKPEPARPGETPAKPSRVAVQERLATLLQRLPDAQAWPILADLVDAINARDVQMDTELWNTVVYDEIQAIRALLPTPPHTAAPRGSRAQLWHEAVETLQRLKDEYESWLDRLPDNLRLGRTAEMLEEIVRLDLSELEAVEHPQGFGQD
jgi:hypothetical protein